ncbi:MAG: type II toxin-antitoxin system HigB family toxin [Dokdonella sp.]
MTATRLPGEWLFISKCDSLAPVRVISNKTLVDFSALHRAAREPLQAWRKLVEKGDYANFAGLRAAFASVDKAGNFHVFDIGGNKFRVIAAIHFNRQKLFVRHVFTHAEYDDWKPRS